MQSRSWYFIWCVFFVSLFLTQWLFPPSNNLIINFKFNRNRNRNRNDWIILIYYFILQLCTPRVLPSSPEEHYRAVCRALATESSELRIFLSRVFTNDAEALRIKADAQSSRQELAKLEFSDWVSRALNIMCY